MFDVRSILRRSAVCLIATLITIAGSGAVSAQEPVKKDDDAQPRLSSDRPRDERLDQTGSVPPPRAIPRLRAEVDQATPFDTAELKQQRQEPPVQLLIAGPDTFGYVSVDSNEPMGPVFNFIDISATGTDAGISGLDVGSGPLAIGFPFNFYGSNFDQVAMASNGYLNFNLAGDLTNFNNDCPVPVGPDPDNSIYVLWDDLDLGNAAGQAGFFQTFSPCPNTEGGTGDCAIFQWENAEHWPTSAQFDFQAILYDNGNILMNFGPGNPEQGSGSTTGIENATATDGLTHVCNSAASVPDNFSVLFLYPGSLAAQNAETEPNATAATADAIAAGQCGVGGISPTGDVDNWVRSGANAGDLVFAYVDTGRSSSGFDSLLSVLENDGVTLIESDDANGPGSSSVVAGAIVPTAGQVFFEVREDGDHNTITPYELFQVIADPADTAAEAEPNDSPVTATPVTATVMTGDVAVTGQFDFYSFSANAGDSITVIMDDDPDDDTDLTDTEIQILAPDGVTVLANGDDNSTSDGNAAGRTIALTDGTYFLSVDNLFNNAPIDSDTDYRFTVLVNCARVCQDDDGDGVCNPADLCNGDDATGDTDGDGVCDDIDPCPVDNPDDTDGDGVCDSVDPCPTDNPDDSDGDGVCDSADACPGADDTLDANGNGTPDCQEPPPAPPPAPQPTPDACGCNGGTGGMMVMPMTLLGMGWLRRKKRRWC